MDETMNDHEHRALHKSLGLFDVFCVAAGAMISSGLFVLPGLAHAQAGPAVVFSYFFAGLLAATGMLSVAEIITAMPKAGGDYFFIMRTLAALAQIVGSPAFETSWRKARDVDRLRDVLRLTERKRACSMPPALREADG